ncbi:hypothetical protein SeMB42_g03599 [Synchytrium endobioticum]|uniref:Glycosyltransferase family 92 protein n=1 Tax=Synchytrium endobioticum TaxID=286115 RepID=A0A507D5D2_9FUNG|nr:hypothetical protein SeMB42_g03599 [Synchytrium endobioticum]
MARHHLQGTRFPHLHHRSWQRTSKIRPKINLMIHIPSHITRVRIDAPGASMLTTWASKTHLFPTANLGVHMVFANDSDTMPLNIAYHHHMGFDTFYIYDNSLHQSHIRHQDVDAFLDIPACKDAVVSAESLTTSGSHSASPSPTWHPQCYAPPPTASLIHPLSPSGRLLPLLNLTTVDNLLTQLEKLIIPADRPLRLIFVDWQYPYFVGNINSGQVTAQNHAIYLSAHRVDWLMLIDHEEYFVPRHHSTALAYLDTIHPKYVAVSIQSVWYDTLCDNARNTTFYDNTNYIEKLLWRNPKALGVNYRQKTIVRPHLVKQFRTHFVEVGVSDVLQANPKDVWFHHYRRLTVWTRQRATECMNSQDGDVYDARIVELWKPTSASPIEQVASPRYQKLWKALPETANMTIKSKRKRDTTAAATGTNTGTRSNQQAVSAIPQSSRFPSAARIRVISPTHQVQQCRSVPGSSIASQSSRTSDTASRGLDISTLIWDFSRRKQTNSQGSLKARETLTYGS